MVLDPPPAAPFHVRYADGLRYSFRVVLFILLCVRMTTQLPTLTSTLKETNPQAAVREAHAETEEVVDPIVFFCIQVLRVGRRTKMAALPPGRFNGPGVNASGDFGGTNGSQAPGEGTNTSQINPLTSFGIQVAVRVRPFNKRELAASGAAADGSGGVAALQPVLELERDRHTMTLLDPTRAYAERAVFTFDHCFSAFRPSVQIDNVDSPSVASANGAAVDSDDDDDAVQAERAQAEVYQALGQPMVTSAWEGYNSCIFAYGQTSSGKTYTMMGTKRDPGVIPRVCRALFERIESEVQQQLYAAQALQQAQLQQQAAAAGGAADDGAPPASPAAAPAPNRKRITVSVSYLEIYNEQVKDLLKARPKPGDKKTYTSRFDTRGQMDDEYQSLKVRQHPLHGPFVEGITKVDALSWHDAVKLIRSGNDNRSSCSTEMNDSSSRSHAIFQLIVTQTEALGAKVRGKEVVNHKVSKINLVDLAGSERITKTNVTGKHITEANYINQSLSTLRKVIDVLVSRKKAGKTVVVPYRESLLTWILSDNFGGNSKTMMIAAVSPHASNFAESESTLRYATLAKGIVNRIRVNEDPSAKLIRELQAQLRSLQTEMSRGPQQERVRDLEEQMEENKKAMEELLAREEGMRILIHESRLREEKLRLEKETLEKDQMRWKKEAERLKREKDELRTQLRNVVNGGQVDATLGGSTNNFWNDDPAEAAAVTTPEPSTTADDSACPPHQQLLVRKRSSVRYVPQQTKLPPSASGMTNEAPGESSSRASAAAGPPAEASSADPLASTAKPKASKPAPAPFLDPDPPSPTTNEPNTASTGVRSSTDNPAAAGDRPGPSISPGPHAKFGRRANTGEGERSSGISSNDATPQVRTADAPRRGRAGAEPVSGDNSYDSQASGGAPPTVPPSLAHLVAPATTNGVPVKQRSAAAPDALDSFLSGGGAQDGGKGGGGAGAGKPRERGVPPWRQKRNGVTGGSSVTPGVE